MFKYFLLIEIFTGEQRGYPRVFNSMKEILEKIEELEKIRTNAIREYTIYKKEG